MTECTDCGTTFDPERDTVGSSTRCPSCGADHANADRDVRGDGGGQVLEVPPDTTVRITIEVFPGGATDE